MNKLNLTTEQLERRILNGETVTPDELVQARYAEEATRRIEQLKAEREAELAKLAAEEQQRLRRQQQHQEREQQQARLSELEERLTGGQHLNCDELLELREPLQRKLDAALQEVGYRSSPPIGVLFETPWDGEKREKELKKAQDQCDHYHALVNIVEGGLRTIPNTEKQEYLDGLRSQIQSLECRKDTLDLYRKENSKAFYTSNKDGTGEYNTVIAEIHRLKQELNGADNRDRSSAGALESFKNGLKRLIHAHKNNELSKFEMECFLREVMAGLGAKVDHGTDLFVRRDPHDPTQLPEPLNYSDTGLGLKDARVLIRDGALDFKTANEHTYGFEWTDALEAATVEIVCQMLSNLKPNGRLWTRIISDDPTARQRPSKRF